jgi:3(or 17)beta-hydroxysteroid dehydrogenase
MMGRVSGKVAIITGAASGMGKADAELLAQEGATVVVTDLNEADGQAVADAIGEQAVFMRLNVTDEENWKAVISATVEQFGRLDILVNNAGMIALGNIVDTDLESWRMVNAVNSDGVFLGCKHAIPAMAESGGGSIINMSSVAAIHGQSFVAAYTASKGAVRALTKNIAMFCKEQKNGIRCNSVHPDGVKTPMVVKVATGKETATREDIEEIGKFGNMCEPEDIANLVLYLASDESRFVNGAASRRNRPWKNCSILCGSRTVSPPMTFATGCCGTWPRNSPHWRGFAACGCVPPTVRLPRLRDVVCSTAHRPPMRCSPCGWTMPEPPGPGSP